MQGEWGLTTLVVTLIVSNADAIDGVRMVSISEAEKLAADFIKGKRQDFNIEVQGAHKTSEGWIVKGLASHREPSTHASEEWEVTIEAGQITGYEFGKSTGWGALD